MNTLQWPTWMFTVGLVAALAAPRPAHAWRHLTTVWLGEGPPVEIHVADDGTPYDADQCLASDGLIGCCEEGAGAAGCVTAATNAINQWLGDGCADLDLSVRDGRVNADFIAVNQGPVLGDGINAITFDDPTDEFVEVGTYAAAFGANRAGRFAFIRHGVAYYEMEEVDIVFNRGNPFVPNAVLTEQDTCVEDTSLEKVMTHELGHLLGLAHTCESGDPCTDSESLGANMYFATAPCDVSASEPNDDDLQGIRALYGAFPSVSCSPLAEDRVLGNAPLEVRCTLSGPADADYAAAVWSFGDGTTATGSEVAHVYLEPGRYDLVVDLSDTDAACGETSNVANYSAFVRVCPETEAEFRVAAEPGLRVQLLNESDLSVFGCISAVEWSVFEGVDTTGEPLIGPLDAWETAVDLPAPGTYTAVLTLGGIGGTAAARATFDVQNGACGCATPPGPGGAALALIGLLALRQRRTASPGCTHRHR